MTSFRIKNYLVEFVWLAFVYVRSEVSNLCHGVCYLDTKYDETQDLLFYQCCHFIIFQIKIPTHNKNREISKV